MSTVESIVHAVKSRGLRFDVVNGQPVLRGPVHRVTEPLKRALAEFRSEILDFLKLEATKPAPAIEPDFSRTVQTMDGFGARAVVVNPCGQDWKMGMVAWQYLGENGWRQIAGREHLFPKGVPHQ
jgi:hypothetical protein